MGLGNKQTQLFLLLKPKVCSLDEKVVKSVRLISFDEITALMFDMDAMKNLNHKYLRFAVALAYAICQHTNHAAL